MKKIWRAKVAVIRNVEFLHVAPLGVKSMLYIILDGEKFKCIFTNGTYVKRILTPKVLHVFQKKTTSKVALVKSSPKFS